MAELGVGWISIRPEVSKINPDVARALDGLDPVAERSGKSMGGRLSSALGTSLKASVAGAGLAAGGVIAASISKGMGRLVGIENAQASLKGLGHDAQSVESIMDNALASVSGTAFGLEAAAGVAASAVAAGIKPGQDLERTLKLTGDAATIAGLEMGHMGSIVNKVATSNKMQMDVANQLMDAGIPILQMVATELGVTAEEAQKMASDGKVSFETFQTALEKGVGGAALKAGDTFQGAFANMGAALGRVGATALEPFFDLSKQGFGSITGLLDEVNARLKPLAAATSEWLQGTAVPGLIEFKNRATEAFTAFSQSSQVQSLLAQTGIVITGLVEAGRELAPVMMSAGGAIAQASAALGVGTWQLALVGLEGIGAAAKLATPPLEMITGLMNDHPMIVTAAVAAYAGFKTIPGIMDKINPAMLKITEGTKTGTSSVKLFGETFGEAYGYMRKANPEMTRAGATLRVLGGEGGVAAAGFDKLKGAANGVMGLFGGPWGLALAAAGIAVTSVVQANQRAEAAQVAMAAASREAASAQIELKSAVAGTTGQLNDQAMAAAATVIKGELSELVELGQSYDSWLYKVDTDANAWERMFNIGGQWEADKAAAREAKAEYEAIQGVLEGAGIGFEDLYGIIAAGGPEYDDLINRLRATEGGGVDAANGLEKVRGELEATIAEARLLDPAVQQGAAAIDILANAAGDADTRLGGLRKLMQAMGLAPKDAEEAMKEASAAIREVVDAAGSLADPADVMGASLIGVSGKIDTTSKNGEVLFDKLKGLGEELMNVASNGGDVDGKLREMQPALQTLADDFDLPVEKIRELGRGFGLVPRELRVGIAIDGADGVTQELGDIWQAVEHLQVGGEPIRVQVESEDAKLAIEEAGFALEKIEGTESSFWINAETEDAQGALADVILKMDEIDDLEVNPEIFLNDRELITSANNAKRILAALDIQDPSPEASLIIQDLLNGVNLSQAELDFLATQSPTLTADLQKDLLESGVKLSNEMLEALHERPTKPVIDADSKPLEDAAAKAQKALDDLPEEVITRLRIQEWKEYYTTGTSAGGGGVGRAAFGQLYADGGRAHDGYRLPTSGPGTDTVDGFFALDSNHMPLARLDAGEWVVNRDSSEKYDPLLNAINRDDVSSIKSALGALPGLADGGTVDSITKIVNREFPEMDITSTHRPGHTGYHGRNLAVDFSNGNDTTPEMARAAEFFYKNFGSELAQLIHYGPWNIGAGEPVGDGSGFYGPGTMADHRDHVHIAAEQPLTGAGGGHSVVPGSQGTMGVRQSRSMSWSSAPTVKADFGEASDFNAMASKYLRVGDRSDVELGVTKTSNSYITSPGAYPRVLGGGSHNSYVEAIAANAKDHGLPERGAMIGVGTSFVEAGNPIRMWANNAVPESLNYPHDAVGSDHDSVGIFQQRDNGAWGTLAQRMDAYESAGLFFDTMLQKFPNWKSMEPGAVAQGVQASAFPDRYATTMDAALEAVRATSIYDQGGWLMPRTFGFNASPTPEPVFNAAQWPILAGIVQSVPPMVQQMGELVPALHGFATASKAESRAGGTADDATVILEATRGATRWFDETELVMDAERGLAQVREQATNDIETLQAAEEALVEAQENLAHAQSAEAELSTSMQRRLADAEKDLAEARNKTVEGTSAQTRKIADAEKALNEAREGGDTAKITSAEKKLARAREDVAESTAKSTEQQAKKIADAELKLTRLREDAQEELAKSTEKRSEEAVQAAKDVEKAEKNLANARKNVESSTARIEAAERTVAAARIQAVGNFVSNVTSSLAGMASAVAAFTTDMARMASMVEATQQAVSSERQALARHNIAVVQAQNAYRIAEWDVLMARQKGLEDLNSSESALSDSRNQTMKIGSTSVSALGKAVDRFRTSGVWAADAWISSSANMAMATAGYSAQAQQELVASEERKAAALAASETAQLEALHRQEIAGLAVAEATMLQLQSAEILRLHTENLEEQTRALYGMSPENAGGAGSFLDGLANILGGGGGLVTGIVTGLAGFASGGPLGAIPGVLTALQSLPSLFGGITKVVENHGEAREAWDELDFKAKVMTVLGLSGAAASTAAGVAGSANGLGPEALVGGVQVGEGFIKATLESFTASMDARLEAADRRHQAQLSDAQQRHDKENADFQLDAAEKAARREIELASAQANQEWYDLQVKIAETNHAESKEILEAQLEVAEGQRDDMRQLLEEFDNREPAQITLTGDAFSANQVKEMMEGHFNAQVVLESRVNTLESQNRATGNQYATAKR